jgi:hypothetical protein
VIFFLKLLETRRWFIIVPLEHAVSNVQEKKSEKLVMSDLGQLLVYAADADVLAEHISVINKN